MLLLNPLKMIWFCYNTHLSKTPAWVYAVEAQTSLAPLSWFHGSRVTTAHAHQCCIFQSYAKTVPSRMKLTMILTMREPASMTTDTWSRRVTSDFNSAYSDSASTLQNWISWNKLWKFLEFHQISWNFTKGSSLLYQLYYDATISWIFFSNFF